MLKIIPCLFLLTLFTISPSSGWENPITTSTLAELSTHSTHFLSVIPTGFEDITEVGNIYGTIRSYTRQGCPLRWIVRTRGNYIPYYMGIQAQIDETKHRVLANYTYLSGKLEEFGHVMDSDLAAIDTVLNTCPGFDKETFMNELSAKLQSRMQAINSLDILYASVAGTVPYSIVYNFPNALIKALKRESIINYVDLGTAVHWAETLHYHIDRMTLFQALADYEFALTAFHYEVFEGTRSGLDTILKSAFLKASKCEM